MSPGISPLEPVHYEQLLRDALAEDLGRAGDLTSMSVVPGDARARARICCREPGRLAGIDVALAVFRRLDPELTVQQMAPDGKDLSRGEVVLEIDGRARALLAAERTALNFLAHLSGVATATRTLVAAVAETTARVCCTRKTTPGLRALEKYAVRVGGGRNHRFGLDDAVLIKDNHLSIAGGVGEALRRARSAVGHLVRIEVEVETLDQLEAAIAGGADAVLLDNMSTEQLRQAVNLADGRVVMEASGGIDEKTIADVAATGVDVISCGALTHSARALDLSMELEPADEAERPA